MIYNKKFIGQKGEELACEYLLHNGYVVLDKNVRIGRGEIDVVCIKDSLTIFVEVKARTSRKYGIPEEAITYRKALKLAELANKYLQIHQLSNIRYRIDVVVVEMKNTYQKANIRHIKNAIEDCENDELDYGKGTM